jgi:hypothetical protein
LATAGEEKVAPLVLVPVAHSGVQVLGVPEQPVAPEALKA